MSWLHTRFCAEFGVRYPIVQTGMGWVSGASLVAATADAGGLGFLGAVTMTHEEMVAAIRKVRSRTAGVFGVNLRPDQPDLGDRLTALENEHVRVVGFAGGPSKETLARVRDAGMLSMVTIGRPRHAEKMAEAGANAVIAQGAEGGGHTGDVPTSLLVPAAVDTVGGRMTVLAAGGIRDGRGLAAALVWGADGIAMGTRFLLTAESRVPDDVKRRYLAAGYADSYVSDSFDGQPMRVLQNETAQRYERVSRLGRLIAAPRNVATVRRHTGMSWADVVREGLALRRREGMGLAQLARAADAPVMIKRSMVDGDPVGGLLPAGMVSGFIDDVPTVADLIGRITGEAGQAAARLGRTEES